MRAPGLKQRDDELFELANRQFGLLRHDDLLKAGVTQSAIGRRLADRRLTRVHHKVYALGHTALQDEGRWLAGLWACGEDAALSHASAAAFHHWPMIPIDDAVHVSSTGTRQSRAGLTIHRVSTLDRRDVHRTRLLRVTTIPRTLVDLADVMTWPRYRALADALPGLDVAAIRAAQARAPKRAGRGLVTRLIEADDAHTKSEFERRFLHFLKTHGLPRPDALNAMVAGHKADCVYQAAAMLIVELDGRVFHARRAHMRADRRRDSDYQLAGFRILRLVWDDLHQDEAGGTADRLCRMLQMSSA